MRKKLLSFFRKTTLFCALTCAAAGCSIEGDDVEIVTERFLINLSDWTWNAVYARWECLVEWPYLTEYIYDEATVTGSVYINEVNVYDEVYTTSKNMPFVHTFPDSDQRKFTETVSFDISPGSVCFYIQSCDLNIRREPFQDEYEFKIAVILEN